MLFEQSQASFDPNAVMAVLEEHPYHVDALLTMHELYRFLYLQTLLCQLFVYRPCPSSSPSSSAPTLPPTHIHFVAHSFLYSVQGSPLFVGVKRPVNGIAGPWGR